ncbi:YjbQ family protein [Prosthecochloris sp. N3]|uniref:YjbQ family protein n=1 Tax=Prosthecochloris ethylica TaxID=2743976 RepID=A0ABR9XQK7_9CHLB|nr:MULTISPECIES: secondary thiamine-phosphate synthase enzyme YjbQ [Prosthecochloris]MEC9487854.1 secondary thiamine-phosphate synthase enzyme YjbQ [Prosthecochloris sp.]MBF0585423.1 YjbQ family protein [Prosthecochloris ethylica]MBF0636209.1 YjbQ family protein [Prosthecochloris ethylica]NUK46653.1 YjbQ family protein [Prosthecochloris ethylica]RNA64744.1 YjbQ family protein [Prosthecochloris sp. ZM_2]
MTHAATITLRTKGFSDSIDITSRVEDAIRNSSITEGIITIIVIGSTASITTIEYEPALVEDMQQKLQQLIPDDEPSRHSETWGDDNGFSHMRASLMGPGITMPVHKGRLVRGTWQQVVCIDHDNRPRKREIFMQIIGEA